jgi:hypothetical protein
LGHRGTRSLEAGAKYGMVMIALTVSSRRR